MSRTSLSIVACVLALTALALCAANAGAQTTHLYDHQFGAPGDSIPQAVDANGNLLLYNDSDHSVVRVDSEGNPVPFPDLGSNVIDGFGGNDCPATPADCDKVPSNHFFNTTPTNGKIVGVDDSNGPASGDIYVTNQIGTVVNGTSLGTQVEVFASTGHYIGEIDQTLESPQNCGRDYCSPVGITVDANGHIYLFNNHYSTHHIDQFIPQDATPADDRFVGQLQIDQYDDPTGSGKPLGLYLQAGVATPHFTYAGTGGGGYGVAWRKYAASAYLASPKNRSIPVDFSPEPGPFGPDYGLSPACNGCNYMAAAADQSTGDIYLGGRTQPDGSDGIQEYTEGNVKVGPNFGVGKAGPATERGIAVDGTNNATRGFVYARGASSAVEVFGAPVIIPDVTYSSPTVGHTTATIKATVGPAGGSPVTDCHIDYGLTTQYGTTVPCDQATPYSGDTAVNVPLSSLFIETTYHYRVVASNAIGTTPGLDQTFHTHAVLDASTDPATNITTGGADLNGTVNPDGMDTQYYFDYGSTAQYGHSTDTLDAGAGTGDISVPPVSVSGLQSGRIYHYRMVATNSLGTTFAPEQTFKVATSPKITGVGATNVTATSADVNARINPSGFDTTYHFEYGATQSYGSRTPATDADIGSADADQSVSAHLDNLQSGVTYHFRVIATNKWGTTVGDDTTFSYFPPNCPNAHVRQQVGANYLPDCRAYELVSPGDAGGIQLFAGNGVPNLFSGLKPDWENLPQNSGYASNPSRFTYFGALGSIPGTHAPDSLVDMYAATRTTHGWVSTYPGISGDQSLFVVGPHCSADISQCYDIDPGDLWQGQGFADPTDVGSTSPYLWNVDGSLSGRLPTNQAVVRGSDSFNGTASASADFSHFVFSSSNVPFAAGGVIGAPGSVYDNNTQTDTVTIVSKLPSGDPIPQSGSDPNEFINIPAVSTDGSHILMSTQSALNGFVHLYETVGDAHYYDVSKGYDVTYLGSSSDGSRVFFTSPEQITSDDHDNSVDIFMWSEATDSITRITQGNGNGDSDSCTTQWDGQTCNTIPVNTGVSTDDVVSADGALMFYSPEQLDPQNPGIPDEKNLYLYHDGRVQYVSTLDPAFSQGIARLQLSPDGSKSAFVTRSSLTGYDNTSPDGVCSRDKDGGPTSGPLCDEMFSFDADSGDLKCVSCIPSGAPPNHDATASASGRFMSDDGRAFFSTADSLDPKDTNGLVDVYEYVEGRPQLISSGTGQQDTWGGGLLIFPRSVAGLEAVSRDGTDVYFSTFDTLVSSDHNGQFLKFYDARTNGGFPDVPPDLPCTAADECHGAGNPTPANPQVGTGAALGSGGNVHAATKSKKKAHKKTKRHKRHHARSKRHG